MADGVDAGIGDRLHQPLGLLPRRSIEVGVNGRHRVVEQGPEVGVVVETAARADVQLTAPQDRQVRVFGLEGLDGFAVLEELLGRRTVYRQVLAVIGDGQIVVAPRRRDLDHLRK